MFLPIYVYDLLFVILFSLQRYKCTRNTAHLILKIKNIPRPISNFKLPKGAFVMNDKNVPQGGEHIYILPVQVYEHIEHSEPFFVCLGFLSSNLI